MTTSSYINLAPPPVHVKDAAEARVCTSQAGALEKFFSTFQANIIGRQQAFDSPFGRKEIIYADWTATGRTYRPIEEYLQKQIMPFLGNTHTKTTITGTLMSKAYEEAKLIIKKHVRADSDDILIFCGSGTTGAVNKLQRILGMRMPERISDYIKKNEQDVQALNNNMRDLNTLPGCPQSDITLKPVVFLTHMEHHSNQTSWLETIATVEIIEHDKNGNVNVGHLRWLLEQYKNRENKIAAITGCSNVTGIQTPYQKIAKLMHEYGGLCFVDFACSAPYINIDMHPQQEGTHLDAIYFSPHKFLGGPGTPGVLVFNKKMYKNAVPDQPGGGTILYSNPWRVHEYITDIEQREDGGTPPILQGIKAAMCIRLKEEMGVKNILRREEEILRIIFDRFSKMKNVDILEGDIKSRLGVISFIVKGAHHDLIVKMLNDGFGIQTRGGCSCAGTYGHMLLNVDERRSHEILNSICAGDLLSKPGWIRLSIHPTMSNADISFIMDAIELTSMHFDKWAKDYTYSRDLNEYSFKGVEAKEQSRIADWFNVSAWV